MLNEKVFVVSQRKVHEGTVVGNYISKQTGYEKIEVATEEVVLQADKCCVYKTEAEAKKALPGHIKFLNEMIEMINDHQKVENDKRKEMIGEPLIAPEDVFPDANGGK